MKYSTQRRRIAVGLALLLSSSLPCAAQESINHIRDSAKFLTVSSFGTAAGLQNLATEDGSSPGGIPFAEFSMLLTTAIQSGRGGIINFDNPVYGNDLVDFDRSAVRAFIEDRIDAYLESGGLFLRNEERQSFIDESRRMAYESDVVDTSTTRLVVSRRDPGNNASGDAVVSSEIFFDRLDAIYGRRGQSVLSIRRGPLNYVEGSLATFDGPGHEDLSFMINDNYFFGVGRSGYSGGAMSAISTPFTFNLGMGDLLFDARDNVTALGFSLLSVNNFQYWQGLGGVPDRPDNIRVSVSFSDGSEELLTSTTRQSNGGWNTFFAIRAPEGSAIVRLNVRIVGRNWRTFVLMDDLAFITTPSVPYMASEAVASGSVAAPFYHLVRFGQNPETINASGLPTGLVFDAESGLISGVPTAAGEFAVKIALANSLGAVEETLLLQIGPAVGGEDFPRFAADSQALSTSVVLGRELTPVQLQTTLDATAAPGELEFFTVAYRLNDDGTRSLTTLDAAGFGLPGGRLEGRPTMPSQLGSYLIRTFVRNRIGGDVTDLFLSVFPVVPVPNFDGDSATDVIWRDAVSGRIYVLRSNSSYLAASPPVDLLSAAVDTGFSASFVGFGDVDANNHADIFAYTSGSTEARMAYFYEDFGETLLTERLTPHWEPIHTGDFRGDGGLSVLWKSTVDDRWAVWHYKNYEVAWFGLWFSDPGREFVMGGDFSGNGITDLLFRTGAHEYELVEVRTLTSSGTIEYLAERFTLMPEWQPHLAADFNGDGMDDLMWKNSYSGAVAIWLMNGASVPESALPQVELDADGEPIDPLPELITAQPGPLLFSLGTPFEVVTTLDVDEDQRKDLLLWHRDSGAYYLMRMNGLFAKAAPIALTAPSSGMLPVAIGDYDGDKREDLLMRDPATGRVSFWLMQPDGISAQTLLGTFSPQQQFISVRRISTDRSLPPGRNDAVAPWTGAVSQGQRWFYLPWFGEFYDPVASWIYHRQHGYLFHYGAADSLWLYDTKRGWLWTSAAVYPWMFDSLGDPNRPDEGTWLWYWRGSVNPRIFFDFFEFDWVDEDGEWLGL